jgi:hypothetical protein
LDCFDGEDFALAPNPFWRCRIFILAADMVEKFTNLSFI